MSSKQTFSLTGEGNRRTIVITDFNEQGTATNTQEIGLETAVRLWAATVAQDMTGRDLGRMVGIDGQPPSSKLLAKLGLSAQNRADIETAGALWEIQFHLSSIPGRLAWDDGKQAVAGAIKEVAGQLFPDTT